MEISAKYLYAVQGWVLWCALHSTLMLREAPIFRWEGSLRFVQVFLLAVSVYLFIAGGRHYSWVRFLGISQIKVGRAGSSLADSSTFVVSCIHRIIRHPWYVDALPMRCRSRSVPSSGRGSLPCLGPR